MNQTKPTIDASSAAGRLAHSDDRTVSASLGQEMAAQAEAAAELLKTLGNAQRLRILCLLVEGEFSVSEINASVALSQSALSQHLAVLREQALVNTRRDAQTIYYSLAQGPARALLHTLHELYCPVDGEQEVLARTNSRRVGRFP